VTSAETDGVDSSPFADTSPDPATALVPRDARVIAALRAAMKATGAHTPILKERSVTNIEHALRAISQFCGPDGIAHAIVHKSKLLHSCMSKRWPHPPTLARSVSAVVSALKYDTRLGTKATSEFWKQRLGEANAQATVLAKDNVLTEREAATMPGFDEMRETCADPSAGDPHASLNSQEFLWLEIATTIAPKRADWGQLMVVASKKRVPVGKNALVLPSRPKQATLVLVYKTQDTYHEYTETLSKTLTSHICDSIRIHPRKYLFVGRDGGAFKSRASWRQWVQRTFTNLLGHKATVNVLRKVWVQTFADPSKTTIAAQEELASKMLRNAKSQCDHYFHKIPSK
jgi:hypothetical protein